MGDQPHAPGVPRSEEADYAALSAARNYLKSTADNGIRALDLPEYRIALAASERDRIEQRAWMWDTKPFETCWQSDGFDRGMIESQKRAAIESAELYYVAPSMAGLAEVASETMPLFDMSEEDFPSRSGLLLFGKPLDSFTNLARSDDCRCGKPHITSYAGLMWTIATSSEGLPTALLFPIIDQHLSARMKGGEPRVGLPRLYVYTAKGISLSGPREHGHDHQNDSILGPMLRTLRSACMLMQQPLADVQTESPDRAAQKRMRRAGQEPKAIRVIELRRPKGATATGDSARDYQHQWIVRGHWRNHWHPKREVHRPVWIAPHVKGPEGAPLLGGEKVYALKR